MNKILAAIFLLSAVCFAVEPKNRVLVLVDKDNVKQTHSVFLKSLEERGLKVTIKRADDQNLELIKFGDFLYDHLVIFAPSVQEFGGSLSVNEIVKFIDGGGNVLVAASTNVGDAIRELAIETGFEFDDDGTSVIDHHSFDTSLDSGDHTTLVIDSKYLTKARLIAGDRTTLGPILYRGSALVSGSSNKLKLDVLNAPTTAYSFAPGKVVNEYPGAVGRSTILVGALQARNNARVVLTGSLDLFSDQFINANTQPSSNAAKAAKSGNGDFVKALSKWVFQETGVLRVKSVFHHKVGEKQPPREYTITDDVEYTIEIEEMKDGKWVPYSANDVQLEFVRIDPFVRTTLKGNGGKFKAVFKLPDVYGVFKFLVDYRRVGYTHLFDVQQVSVRPLLHTQYERFIRSAYPYYASSLSMMVGVILFSCVFLYYKETPKTTSATHDTKKTQ